MKKSNGIRLFLAGLLLVSALSGCAAEPADAKNPSGAEQTTENTSSERKAPSDTAAEQKAGLKYSNADLDDSADEQAQRITLGDGDVLIDRSGTYILSGTLSDGQIVVTLDKTEKAHLILEGVDVSNSDGPALHITSCDKVILTLADGTVNRFADGASYADDSATGCIYSKDDLTINGSGTLEVTGNCKNGIAAKNKLKIVGGTIRVSAVTNGLKGKDSVAISGGELVITAGKDGIKSDNIEEAGKGVVAISGGSIDITAADDGIQGEGGIYISGGSVSASVGDKLINTDGVCEVDESCVTRK